MSSINAVKEDLAKHVCMDSGKVIMLPLCACEVTIIPQLCEVSPALSTALSGIFCSGGCKTANLWPGQVLLVIGTRVTHGGFVVRGPSPP